MTDTTRQQYDALMAQCSHNAYAMRYWESQGLATSLAIAPELILPTRWVPAVFANDVPQSDLSAKAVVELLSTQIKQLRLDFEDHQFRMPLPLDIDSNDQQRADLADWCRGFMQGVYLDEEHWFKRHSDTVFNLLTPIYIISGHEHYASRFREVFVPEPNNTLSTLIPELLDGVFRLFHKSLANV